jgi:hypothetical protein
MVAATPNDAVRVHNFNISVLIRQCFSPSVMCMLGT